MTAGTDIPVVGPASSARRWRWASCGPVPRSPSAMGPRMTLHASAANFGLVRAQGKGLDAPDDAAPSRCSAEAWPRLAQELTPPTGIATGHVRCGGVKPTLGAAGLEHQANALTRMHTQPGGANRARLLNRAALDDLLPGLGPGVTGGVWCPHDGHANPLASQRALRAAPAGGPRLLLRGADLPHRWDAGHGAFVPVQGKDGAAGALPVWLDGDGAEPGQGLHPSRHGGLSGMRLCPSADLGDCRRDRCRLRCGRCAAHPRALYPGRRGR